MGYYTTFELKLEPDSQEVWKHIEENEDIYYAVSPDGDSYKWYNHDSDMKVLSKKFPEILFKLHGEGEEAGDVWYTYYKNGQMQHCPAIITFEEFDETKLK